MINLDMGGVGDRFELSGSAAAAKLAQEVALAEGIGSAALTDSNIGRSDQLPTVMLHWSDDPNYHTKRDRSAELQAGLMDGAARVALDLFVRTAGKALTHGAPASLARRRGQRWL